MPELPEVETVRRGLEPAMVGATFLAVTLRRPDLRFPFPDRFAERLTGARVTALARRAKFLAAALSTGETLIMHLGMSGRFTVETADRILRPGDFHHETGKVSPHDHVVFDLGGARVTYNDTRRFGFMSLAPTEVLDSHPHFAGLGLEPLGNDFHADAIDRLFSGKTAPLKAALLDQRLIAGLGNIYVCEALHLSHLSPFRSAGTIAGTGRRARDAREGLAAAIRAVLTDAIAAGGSTLRDYAHTDGSLGYFQHRFRVYDREGEPCPTPGCGGVIRRDVQAGRSTFWCGGCQG